MKIVIKKSDQLRPSIGHFQQFCGTGAHRNWKKQPKGGRNASNRKAVREFE